MIDRLGRPLVLIGIVLLAALVGAGAMWATTRAAPGSLSGVDKARVETVVHEYVLTHPEIIPEAMRRLQEGEAGRTIAANRAQIVAPFGSAWAGNPNGDVTLVEYFDYNCGYCRASLPIIAELIARDPGVKVVFREWPILSEASVTAATVSLAAADQGKFKAFHDALYAAGPVSAETIAASARASGIDMARAAALRPRAEAEIAANRAVAQKLGLTGTPSWVIGNRVVSAALPLEDLEKAVSDARDAS